MVQVGLVAGLGLLAFACSFPEARQQTAALASSVTTVVSTDTVVPPAEGRYTFYHSWHWEYENTWIPEGEYGRAGEMTAYQDDSTGAWLFTSEAYGVTGEMAEWVLALPTGEYITAYCDGEGTRGLLRDTLEYPVPDGLLAKHLQPTGSTEVFGENDYGWPSLRGAAHRIDYVKTNEEATIWLADTAVDMRPLIHFNRRMADAKLPIHFTPDLPAGCIEVAEETRAGAQHVRHRLTAISNNYYEIDLNDYENH